VAKNFILIVAAIVVGGLVLCFIGMMTFGWFASGASTAGQTYDVRYELIGSAQEVSVTLNNAQGNTEQRDVALPYTVEYEDVAFMTFLYISAQISDTDGGDLKCRIIVNGEEVSTAAAEGFPNIASCSATAE
jgi:hypothetical protein